MNKAIFKNKIILVYILVILFGGIAVVKVLIFPEVNKIESLRSENAIKKIENLENLSLITEANFFVKKNEKVINGLIYTKSDGQIVSEVLSDIEEASKRSGVNVLDVKVNQTQNGTVEVYSVSLEILSGFSEVIKFFIVLQNDVGFFSIKELRIQKNAGVNGDMLKGFLVLNRYFIKKEIKEKIVKISNFLKENKEFNNVEQRDKKLEAFSISHNTEVKGRAVYRDFFISEKELFKEAAKDEIVHMNLRNNLKLLGIILDENPKAVFEVINTREVLFLSKGEYWENIFISDISEKRVSFDIKGTVQFLEL